MSPDQREPLAFSKYLQNAFASSICLGAEGWHRTIFMDKNALDYVTLPTHQYMEGRTESVAGEVDAIELRRNGRAMAQSPVLWVVGANS